MDSINSSITERLSKQIKLLTFNFFLRPPGIKNGKSDYKDERLALIGAKIRDNDIVCFQEVFSTLSYRKHKLKMLAEAENFKYLAESPSPSLFSPYITDGGLLTLSKHPIIDSEYHSFEVASSADKLCNKGVLYTRIFANNGVIHVFNTHLQASYQRNFNHRTRISFLARFQQIIEVRNFIDDKLTKIKANHNDLVLLVGDFNVDCNGLQVPLEEYREVFKIEMKNFDKRKIYNLIPDDPKIKQPGVIHEYDLLMHVLTKGGEVRVLDHHRISTLRAVGAGGKKEQKEGKEGNEVLCVTFGAQAYDEKLGRMAPVEKFFTWSRQVPIGIDYVFEFVFGPQKGGEGQDEEEEELQAIQGGVYNPYRRFRVVGGSCRPNEMLCDEKAGVCFTHMSDHYALEISLRGDV